MSKKNRTHKKQPAQQDEGMQPYSSIEIEGFRGIKHLELTALSNINLLFGPNNSGKTSILEAIFLHASGLDYRKLSHIFRPPVNRETFISNPFLRESLQALFHEKDPPYKFSITATLGESSEKYILEVTYKPTLDDVLLGDETPSIGSLTLKNSKGGCRTKILFKDKKIEFEVNEHNGRNYFAFKQCVLHTSFLFIPTDKQISILGQLKRKELIGEFLDDLSMAFSIPKIQNIDILSNPAATISGIFVKIANKWLPIEVLGTGEQRWFYLAGCFILYPNASHCIEEIDFGFHPGSYTLLAKMLLKYTQKYNCQLFLTSHNREFAEVFLDTFYGENGEVKDSEPDPLRFFRLRPAIEYTEVWPLTGRETYNIKRNFNLELI